MSWSYKHETKGTHAEKQKRHARVALKLLVTISPTNSPPLWNQHLRQCFSRKRRELMLPIFIFCTHEWYDSMAISKVLQNGSTIRQFVKYIRCGGEEQTVLTSWGWNARSSKKTCRISSSLRRGTLTTIVKAFMSPRFRITSASLLVPITWKAISPLKRNFDLNSLLFWALGAPAGCVCGCVGGWGFPTPCGKWRPLSIKHGTLR